MAVTYERGKAPGHGNLARKGEVHVVSLSFGGIAGADYTPRVSFRRYTISQINIR